MELYQTKAYQFDLPKELIAQTPCEPRDRSRLLVVDRATQNFTELCFADLKDFLNVGDSLVLNQTKVIPARLFGRRPTGGKVELLLSRPLGEDLWEALAKPAKKLSLGSHIYFGEDFSAEVVEDRAEGIKVLKFIYSGLFEDCLDRYGKTPLPVYIHGGIEEKGDRERYQTIYAKEPGAVAAPTAGLHFSEDLFHHLDIKGVERNYITLHVGLGTFRNVQCEDIREHQMHEESFSISEEGAKALNNRKSEKRQICVGTTCCRTLESCMAEYGKIVAGSGSTKIFIYPGFQFKYVRSLLTNFHVPGSTLLMLVSALGGYELMREAYKKAVKERFRFFSYGDAMLIL